MPVFINITTTTTSSHHSGGITIEWIKQRVPRATDYAAFAQSPRLEAKFGPSLFLAPPLFPFTKCKRSDDQSRSRAESRQTACKAAAQHLGSCGPYSAGPCLRVSHSRDPRFPRVEEALAKGCTAHLAVYGRYLLLYHAVAMRSRHPKLEQ